jgi:hypothetical protein
MNDPDGFIRVVKLPKESSLTFIAEGIPFNAHRFTTGKGGQLVLWATLGVLPYTVTSAQKRRALITILESAQGLPTALFGIDKEMQIVVRGAYTVLEPPPTDYLFFPLIQFLQEARPYIRLIGEFL